MKSVLRIIMIVGVFAFLAAPATADWNPGDDHKMHWPQLPDPDGWDVNITSPNVVADDWECTQPGPVRDIHFWFSVEDDQVDAALAGFESLHVSIHDDVRPDDLVPYSRPGKLLWERDFTIDEIVIPDIPGTGVQGWADPAKVPPVWNPGDHNLFFQANLVDIRRPFFQRGTATDPKIYWLDLSVKMREDGTVHPPVGWKTTFPTKTKPGGGWGDDAVFWAADAAGNMGWQELWEFSDPGGQSLDMAFVITPEPSTISMMVGVALMGLLAFARCRRTRNR